MGEEIVIVENAATCVCERVDFLPSSAVVVVVRGSQVVLIYACLCTSISQNNVVLVPVHE